MVPRVHVQYEQSQKISQDGRSVAILAQAIPCSNVHYSGSILFEESSTPAYNRLVTIRCTAGSVSIRLVSESRAKYQDSVIRYKDNGITFEIDSPFCNIRTTITVRQSKTIEDREIGKQFAPFWRVGWSARNSLP